MRAVTKFPRQIDERRDLWIPMSDGVRLSARAWIPRGAEQAPVPAVLEYIPYRKDDFTAARDALMHPYFAGHGVAAVRVDMRGSGDSEGILADEYLEQEIEDGVEVVNWLAAQAWCSGSVGMIGISWGGFNGLMVAARRPEPLKAVVSVCSSDDRYRDDVHYMGGCLLGDNLSWASVMMGYNSLPPDPRRAPREWREMWLQRLGAFRPWLIHWLEHQSRDAYWRSGSVCENYEDVHCPTLLVSGYADGYTNTVFRLLENLRAPARALVGPWSHKYPHQGEPGPAVGFLQECVRWWRRWLMDEDKGADAGPALIAWMQDSQSPAASYTARPGRWVAESTWPSPNVRPRRWRLSRARLVEGEPPLPGPWSVLSPLSVGLFAGKWCSYSAAPDLPGDQREEDGGCLVFDTDHLDEPLEILGAPEVELDLSLEGRQGMIALRLSDMLPDHQVARVTYGLLNLSHRNGHQNPSPVPAGEVFTVRVKLNDTGYRFPAGHRIRLAVSTSYFPLAWTPPRPAMLHVHGGRLILPARAPSALDATIAMDQPEAAPGLAKRQMAPAESRWSVERDLASEASMLKVVKDAGRVRLEDEGVEYWRRAEERYSVDGDEPASAAGEACSTWGLAWEGVSVETRSRLLLRGDEEAFEVQADLDAYEGNRRVFARSWSKRIRRRDV